MTTAKYSMGDIMVDGVAGFFSSTRRNTFVHIHHCILNDDGIGCKKYEFVGSVSKGIYGDSSQGIRARGNDQFGDQVAEKIQKYIDAGEAQ